jgi:cytochrome c biogenesis protein CcdA
VLTLTLLVATIAVVDSLNPSTVMPALYLAGAPRARGLGSFTVGVFAVNLVGGIVLILGPGPELISALKGIGPLAEHVAEAAAGVALLVFAWLLWRARRSSDPVARAPRSRRRGAAFALGAGIAAIEFPTAFMYFGAVSAILVSSAGAPAQLALVTAYNVLFVLPLVAILAVRHYAGERTERRLATIRTRLQALAPRALAAVTGGAGAVLASLGVVGLLVAG